MAQHYTEYLAINVLNEQQIVSYRLLSRALEVHSNLAKQMLYEFHRKQNAKKPGTVHSTYLITGTRRVESAPYTNGVHSQDDGEDTAMQSSPPLPSSSFPKPDETPGEVVRTRSVMLVKEENLDDAKNLFESISSMHIYSLEANGLSDVQALAECNRKVAVSYASEDPLLEWKQYGTIQNPNARRRPRRTAPPTPAPVAKDAGLNAKPLAATAKVKEETKTEPKQSSAKATPEPGKKDISKPAQTKRQNSDIFKSFAKAKTAPKQDSQSSAEASPAAEPSDEPMTGFSEDEADDDALLEAEEAAKEPTGKNKTEREAELQAMMDQEDEPMDDPSPAAGEQSEELEATVDKAESQKDGEPKENVTVENGRRRGRRRVTKKKTVKDEEGYLVTKEEAAWESFSEDEPPPKKTKTMSAPSTNASGKPSAKKGGRPGQGNIMSFFTKK